MSEYNRALRLAQRVIRDAANRVGTVENGYHPAVEHPDGAGLRKAANLIESLIEPADTSNGSE